MKMVAAILSKGLRLWKKEKRLLVGERSSDSRGEKIAAAEERRFAAAEEKRCCSREKIAAAEKGRLM